MLEILNLPVKDKEIFIFPETKETSKSVTFVSVEIIAISSFPLNNLYPLT